MPVLADVYAARHRIASVVRRTPLVESALSHRVRDTVVLKLETLQSTGSFKLRGALNAISKLSDSERRRGVVCCSTGNHGRAVAHAARIVGARAVVCLSRLVPNHKAEAIEKLSAEVMRIGDCQDDAEAEVERMVTEDGMINISPFDHPDVIAGQGTIGLEILEDLPEVGTIMVPVSGGGLISGIALAAKAIKPSVRIVGLCMKHGSAMGASLEAGKPVTVEEVVSLADSLGGGVGFDNRYTFELCRTLIDDVIRIDEPDVYDGMRSLFFLDRIVAEGSSAVSHGAIVSGLVELTGTTAIIVSGRNVEMSQFVSVITGQPVTLGDRRIRGRGGQHG